MDKVCLSCKKKKPISDFPWHNKGQGTYRAQCKECTREKARKKYLKKIGGVKKKNVRSQTERFIDGMYVCPSCNIPKPDSEYRPGRLGMSSCKECSKLKGREYYRNNKEHCKSLARWSRIKNQYGLSKEQWNEMYNAQDGKCAICREKFTKTPHIDHNHITNKTRGMLCAKCNTAIGSLKADEGTKILKSAIEYLKRK